jgi:hypothetical protein
VQQGCQQGLQIDACHGYVECGLVCAPRHQQSTAHAPPVPEPLTDIRAPWKEVLAAVGGHYVVGSRAAGCGACAARVVVERRGNAGTSLHAVAAGTGLVRGAVASPVRVAGLLQLGQGAGRAVAWWAAVDPLKCAWKATRQAPGCVRESFTQPGTVY